MNLLSQATRVHLCTLGHFRCPRDPLSASSRRLLSTSQWKKYLNILDLNKNSTTKEIKESFLKLSKVYHPDNKTTGSHTKFVELKEAYDALKDGQPTTTKGSTQTSANNYNNYYDTDVSYQMHRAYRDRMRDYTSHPYGQSNYGFGGPYRGSSSPWEELKRDREYRRQRDRYNANYQQSGRGLINVTIILSAMAWIIIYSSVLLIWDYNDSAKKVMYDFRAPNPDSYSQYEDYLKRKEAARALRKETLNNSKYVVKADEPLKSYIMTNGPLNIIAPSTDSSLPEPNSAPTEMIASAANADSNLVGSL